MLSDEVMGKGQALPGCCENLARGRRSLVFRVSKDGWMKGAGSPASEAYFLLYAVTQEEDRNAADGRYAATGLGDHCLSRGWGEGPWFSAKKSSVISSWMAAMRSLIRQVS